LRAPRTQRLDAELPDPEAHLDFGVAHFADPRIFPWHGGNSRGPESVRRMLVAQAAQAAEVDYCLWWWRERSSGELVGYTGLNRDQVEGEPMVEVGWSITPARWGEGLAPEAARAAIDWGFERARVERIVAFTEPRNGRSLRVMEKLGMTYVRDFERAGLPHVLYRVDR
jgi:ribosomal-protein-alanine N-acetyltransferase